MQRIDTPTAVNGMFVNGNPNIGRMATRLDESWFNAVQEELCNVVEGLGNALDKENRNQIISALASRMFDYREVNAAVTPSITLSTLMRKTIIKMKGEELIVNGDFDVLIVIPGNLLASSRSTVRLGSSGSMMRVGRGLVIWGSGDEYSALPRAVSQESEAIDPRPLIALPTNIAVLPDYSVAEFDVSAFRKNMDVTACVIIRTTAVSSGTAKGVAWVCSDSVNYGRVEFQFLTPGSSDIYITINLRFAFAMNVAGPLYLRIACAKESYVLGGSVSFIENYY